MPAVKTAVKTSGVTYTASAVAGNVFFTQGISHLAITLTVSAVSGTSPTLRPYLQKLGEDGAYYTVWTAPANITANGTYSYAVPAAGTMLSSSDTNEWQIGDTIGGTTPSFTIAVTTTTTP